MIPHPPSLTLIAEVRSIDGPGLSADLIDVTNQSSPNSFREKIQGLKDGGDVTFDINYLPADSTHDATTGLIDKYQNGTLQGYSLSFPDSPPVIYTFTAFITNFSPSSDIESQLTASVTLTSSRACR